MAYGRRVDHWPIREARPKFPALDFVAGASEGP